MGEDGTPADALDTAEGAALAGELVEMLEAELVRFCHRVDHDHGIELDRARAAMVMLGKLVGAGVRWEPQPDCAPTRVHEAFSSQLPRHRPLAPILKREIAGFFVATTAVEVVERPARTPAELMRRAGAEPQLWWWASQHDKPDRCWAACGHEVGRLVQVALAFGVATDRVARALAAAVGVVATRSKTRHTAQRNNLVAVLLRLSTQGAAALADPTLIATITKLAFEMTAAQQAWWAQPESRNFAPDGLADVSVHAFQLVEIFQAVARPPDLERIAGLAERADRTFRARGLQLAAMLRKDLDEPVAAAITSRAMGARVP
ncbi:MAG: hypothetical protein ABI867_25750 [Kofleriaceae bacterium]